MMFRERYNGRQKALFHVLAAYSMYNTEVGYCQGMSQVRFFYGTSKQHKLLNIFKICLHFVINQNEAASVADGAPYPK